MKVAHPKAFLIARTSIEYDDLNFALRHLGAPDWRSDSDTGSEGLIEFAGKLCYMSFDKSLNANLTRVSQRSNTEYIQQQIIAQKHGSVLEHASATFLLANVSRVVTHEIVRHRAGTAFSQVSGRYVRSEPSFYMPRVFGGLANRGDVIAAFERAADAQAAAVKEMEVLSEIDDKLFSLKKMLTSAFRRIMGNGQSNHIVVTANHRAWRHMIEMRTAAGAEEEIRDIFGQIADKLMEQFPAIYADCTKGPQDDLGLHEYTFAHSKV